MTERRDSQELGAEAEALLRALRADEDVPPATQARVWRRIERSVEGAGPKGHVRRGMSPGAWAVAALAAAAVLLLASRAGVLGPLVAQRGGEAAPYSKAEAAPGRVVERAAAPVRATAEVEAVPEDRQEAPASEPAPPPAERVKEAKAREVRAEPAKESAQAGQESSQTETRSSLAEEAAMLARAQAAIQGGRAEAAIEELVAYAKRFPTGTLREEHDALRAIALCEAGRTREGRGEAQAFVRERAGSALADRVRGACLAGE